MRDKEKSDENGAGQQSTRGDRNPERAVWRGCGWRRGIQAVRFAFQVVEVGSVAQVIVEDVAEGYCFFSGITAERGDDREAALQGNPTLRDASRTLQSPGSQECVEGNLQELALHQNGR